ncbi:GNAT family N-acetyltransferase [Clostridium perfringens]
MKIKFVFVDKGYNKHFDIVLNNKIVGWVLFREVKHSIFIESINLYFEHRGKGIGTVVVKQLLSKYKLICGCSSPLSVGFWKKVGAEFEYDITKEMIDYLMDIGEYPPFSISA